MFSCMWTNEGMVGCYKGAVKEATCTIKIFYEIAAPPPPPHHNTYMYMYTKGVVSRLNKRARYSGVSGPSA